MANVIHAPLGFKPLPVGHTPTPLSFGFGLSNSNSPNWTTLNTPAGIAKTLSHVTPTSSRSSPPRALKRRHGSEDSGAGDEEMDRSPTPERPKRAPPKRARMALGTSLKGEGSKENKSPGVVDDLGDVDLGVLLARLPAHSLITILSDLIKAQPTLKATVLRQVPRPTIAIARQSLDSAAKKLRDSYPWSNPASSFVQSSRLPASVGFGFGSAPAAPRDDYVLSRITPHINEFVATFMTYLPYFSNDPSLAASLSGSHSTALVPLPTQFEYTTETFDFLSSMCEHILSQPPVGQSPLSSFLSKRLKTEWGGWICQVRAAFLNGRMFGEPTLLRWTETFDRIVEAKAPPEFQEVMRDVRDQWIATVGPYLSVSATQRRMGHHRMDEY